MGINEPNAFLGIFGGSPYVDDEHIWCTATKTAHKSIVSKH